MKRLRGRHTRKLEYEAELIAIQSAPTNIGRNARDTTNCCTSKSTRLRSSTNAKDGPNKLPANSDGFLAPRRRSWLMSPRWQHWSETSHPQSQAERSSGRALSDNDVEGCVSRGKVATTFTPGSEAALVAYTMPRDASPRDTVGPFPEFVRNPGKIPGGRQP